MSSPSSHLPCLQKARQKAVLAKIGNKSGRLKISCMFTLANSPNSKLRLYKYIYLLMAPGRCGCCFRGWAESHPPPLALSNTNNVWGTQFRVESRPTMSRIFKGQIVADGRPGASSHFISCSRIASAPHGRRTMTGNGLFPVR